MKSKEEIEHLAMELYPRGRYISYNPQEIQEGYEREGFVKGYSRCQQDGIREKQIESLFGRPIKEIYDIEKYENPLDAINDIAIGKLQPKEKSEKKYSELQLRFFADELIKGIEEKNKQGYSDIKLDYEGLIALLDETRLF